MGVTIFRGRILSFNSCPQTMDDSSAYNYIEDGALLVKDGIIIKRGNFANVSAFATQIQKKAQAKTSNTKEGEIEIIDHRPYLMIPGLIDTHNHLPQMQVIGSYGAQLLDWLNTYTFPAETRFSDPQHAHYIASAYFDEMLRNGTTTTVAYCSVHKVSAEAYFEQAQKRNICAIGGKVMMDRNAPDGLLDTPQQGYDDSKALIEKWHGHARSHYAITPRFAITSSPEQLEATQTLVQEHPECYVQTHLSENRKEIEFTLELYPDAQDYLSIYQHYGLLGKKSLFGHCIHLTERERAMMAETSSIAVFCPTSNLFIGSGLFNEELTRQSNIPIALATDIGGGTSYSMLKTMDEAYKVLQLQNQNLNPLKSFYMMTLGNAKALSLHHEIGTLEEDTIADLCVLDSHATPAMALRMQTTSQLSEELFILQTMGDDRSVIETYIAGKPSKPANPVNPANQSSQ